MDMYKCTEFFIATYANKILRQTTDQTQTASESAISSGLFWFAMWTRLIIIKFLTWKLYELE